MSQHIHIVGEPCTSVSGAAQYTDQYMRFELGDQIHRTMASPKLAASAIRPSALMRGVGKLRLRGQVHNLLHAEMPFFPTSTTSCDALQ